MPSRWLAVEAGTDVLARARQVQRSWDRLLGEGALGAELSPEATAGLRPTIVESWRRTLATGLDPTDLLAPIEAEGPEVRERWLDHPLGSVAHVLTSQLRVVAEEAHSLVVVTDASGLVLHIDGADWLKDRACEMNLLEGARYSETADGTNGIGTALAADHALQVFAFEHFNPRHHEWICSGAPVHDPVSGRIVGLIDLSSLWKLAHPRSLELVATAAKTVERFLSDTQRDQDARLRRRYSDLMTKSTDLLVNCSGYVLDGGEPARAKPIGIPAGGGEIAMDDGSLAVAEPLGRGEAYLVRQLASPRAGAAQGEARTRELAKRRAAPSRAGHPGRAEEVEGGLPSPAAGERLSAYLEAAIDCVIMADASGRIVEFNPAAERTFGYSRKEALGRTMAELIVPPRLRERHTAAFARFVNTREGSMLGRRVELTGMRADGSEFPVELALSQVEAEPVLICGALRDISAAKQAESRLRELAEEQAALRQVATLVAYESSPDRLVAAVAEQVARVFDVPLVRLIRYEPNAAVVLGGFSENDDEPFPIGSRWELDTPGLLATIRHTGRAARVEDYAEVAGEGAGAVRAAGMRSAVGSPIVVAGRLWGAIVLLSPRRASLPEDTGARLADFTDLVATALANGESRAALSQLADEQAALRRVATLVARGVEPEEMFSTVTNEMAQLFGTSRALVGRFEPDGSAYVVVGVSSGIQRDRRVPIGSRWQLEDYMASTRVYRTAHPVRLERSDFEHASGPMADVQREVGAVSIVGAPIVVEGKQWGFVTVTDVNKRLPADAEKRLEKFTELVATAIANAESRAELAASEARARKLAQEQASLRRVATLVAEGAKSEAVFSAVAHEVAHVFGVQHVTVCRYEPDAILVLSSFEAPEPAPAPPPFPAGRRLPPGVPSLPALVHRTGKPARIDDFTPSHELYAVARQAGFTAAVGVPIVVDGTVWGAVNIASTKNERILPDAEERLARFTDLVGTSVSRAAMRAELAVSEARTRKLAEEQASLRRVATLVAEGAAPTDVFDAVIAEVGGLLGAAQIGLARYENEHEISVLAIRGQSPENLHAGVRLPLDGDSVNARILRTGRPARLNFAEDGSGSVAEVLRRDNVNATVGAPIVVDGALWGMIGASWRGDDQPPADAEERVEKFTELVATAIANTESREALATSEARARDLAGEQAALRRVATLVAEGAGPTTVFSAVAEEVAGLFEPAAVTLNRYDEDVSTVLAASGINFPVGSRWPLDVDNLAARVHATGRPVHVRNYTDIAGAAPREIWEGHPSQSDLGVPIVVDGRLWGVFCVATPELDRNPSDTANRIGRFTELVATAIANSEARDGLRQLVAEQAALRRVATLVAKGVSSDELFAAVTREAADVLDVPVVALQRYEPDAMFTMVAIAGETTFTAGSRWPVEDEGLAGMILATGRPACKRDFTAMPGPLGAALRDGGLISAVGVPIVVGGSVWGFMTAAARPRKPIPDGTEERLARFTELVATAIADSQAREQIAQLASEQAALRRVATMVAQESPPAQVFAEVGRAPASEQLFSTVAREVASVLDVPGVIVTRYEPDGTAVTVGAAFGSDLAGAEQFLGIGTPMPPDPGTLTALVFDTHNPARVDDLSTSPGAVGEVARAAELGSGCAGPIVVNGAVWGKMCVFSRLGAVLPAGTEHRLSDFVELVATAIANYEARAELAASEARSRELADEQAALRRVATLVARGVSPEEIFSAVTNEMGRLFDSSQACVGRFEPDGSAMVVVGVSDGTRGISTGSRWELESYMASTGVYRTGRPVRVERSDLDHVSGPMADVLREIGAVSNVGAPIVVEGKQWGFVTVTDVNKRLPADAEKRLEQFAELLGTAIANADSQAELAASRARIIAAGDDARRRIERDLHDGAQQRLITLMVALRRAEAKLPTGADDVRADLTRVAEGLTTAVDELRELSRGIHPSILTEGGLSPALKALGRRSPVRVKLDMGFERRLPDHVEVAAYYTVSEALTNASKHANATRVWVCLRLDRDALRLSIRDDGVGGADAKRGSGLTGMRDRIEALGGRIKIESPSGSGTLIEVEIPIGEAADPTDEPDGLLSQVTTSSSAG